MEAINIRNALNKPNNYNQKSPKTAAQYPHSSFTMDRQRSSVQEANRNRTLTFDEKTTLDPNFITRQFKGKYRYLSKQLLEDPNFLLIEGASSSARLRLHSPTVKKLSNKELNDLKQKAIEADRRYKKRLEAAIKIQRFWRKIKDSATHKRLHWKAFQTMKQVEQELGDEDDLGENLNIDNDDVCIPNLIVQNEPRTFAYEKKEDKQKEGSRLTIRQISLLVALYKGWKTRRIIRNEHLKNLKMEIGFMIKNKQSDLNDEEIKH